jgi:hypothetical protein
MKSHDWDSDDDSGDEGAAGARGGGGARGGAPKLVRTHMHAFTHTQHGR